MVRSSRVSLGFAAVLLVGLPGLVAPKVSVSTPALARAGSESIRLPLGFTLRGSNGYRIDVFHSSAHTVSLLADRFANGEEEGASYDAPGSFNKTTRTIEAQFGTLGKVEMTFHRQGKRRLHLPCVGKSYLVATGVFSGTFSFTGENSYTSVTTDRVPALAIPKFFTRFACAGEAGTIIGSGPGAELDAWKRPQGSDAADFYVSKDKPKERAELAASVNEVQGNMHIERSVAVSGPASSFTHNRLSTAAAVNNAPPPFIGEATFKQGQGHYGNWLGTLAVSLPGEANVPLAGAGFGAHLYAYRAG